MSVSYSCETSTSLYPGDFRMSLIKSKQRVADHGEVFTPDWLVEKMLDLVKGETERIDCPPSAPMGQFSVIA